MKKTVKKISFILVIAIILSSQVMASSLPVPPVSDVSNQNMPIIVWIRYVLEIALVLTNIVIIVKSIIKNIKIKDKKEIIKYDINTTKIKEDKVKIRYFVYISLVALLLIVAYLIFNTTINLAGGIPRNPKYDLILLIVLYTIPTILNIILYTHINKKSKKLKEGGESKCQE
mgnify:FL=1